MIAEALEFTNFKPYQTVKKVEKNIKPGRNTLLTRAHIITHYQKVNKIVTN